MSARTEPRARASRWVYVDTSALVKRYVQEPGRRELLRILRRHDVVASAILPVELRSAFRRRVAEGTLDSRRLPPILRRMAADRSYWTIVEVGRKVLASAEMLVATHPLRPLDAIHLASARVFAERLPASTLTFVSADRHQADAAAVIGLKPWYIATPEVAAIV